MLERASFDVRIGQFSRRLWPYSMTLLCLVGVATTLLDFLTTYYALELSNKSIIEGMPLSRALLELGGWRLLLVKDVIAVGMYAVTSFAIYQVATVRQMSGLGRFLAVMVLQVYLWARLIPAINNTLLANL